MIHSTIGASPSPLQPKALLSLNVSKWRGAGCICVNLSESAQGSIFWWSTRVKKWKKESCKKAKMKDYQVVALLGKRQSETVRDPLGRSASPRHSALGATRCECHLAAWPCGNRMAVHLSWQPFRQQPAEVTVSDSHTGEGLSDAGLQAADLVIADRTYGLWSAIEIALNAFAFFIFRLTWSIPKFKIHRLLSFLRPCSGHV